jgi:hypothetical protein
MLRAVERGILLRILVVAACAGAAPNTSPAATFVPESPPAGGPILDGERWTFGATGYTLRLERLDDATRQAFIRRTTGSATDPFATRPDRPGGYVSFLVELENHGEGSVSLNPQNCWLVDGRIPQYPLDLPTLQSSYEVLEQELPAAYRTAARALLDGEVVVEPGQRAAGLLVYRPLRERTKRFRVELQVTSPTGGVDHFAAAYRRTR